MGEAQPCQPPLGTVKASCLQPPARVLGASPLHRWRFADVPSLVFNDRMQQDQALFNVRQFGAAARITVPEARLPALAAGLATTLDTMARLLALDYHEAEPTSRFRPPRPT